MKVEKMFIKNEARYVKILDRVSKSMIGVMSVIFLVVFYYIGKLLLGQIDTSDLTKFEYSFLTIIAPMGIAFCGLIIFATAQWIMADVDKDSKKDDSKTKAT